MNAPPFNANDPSSLEMLRAITASLREMPRLIRVVRTVYRRQNRKPQLEPAFVNWIERYVRFYHSKPLGMLDATHVTAYLSHVGRRPGVTRADQEQALDAIRFLHTHVLKDDLGPVDSYRLAEPRRSVAAGTTKPGPPMWEV
jgi:hypothetical protein